MNELMTRYQSQWVSVMQPRVRRTLGIESPVTFIFFEPQRDSVRLHGTHHSRERFGVLQPSGALCGPSDSRKRRRTGALQDASACFHPSRLLMS
jgi:hypothetical protein